MLHYVSDDANVTLLMMRKVVYLILRNSLYLRHYIN